MALAKVSFEKGVKGVGVNAIGRYGKLVIQFATGIILARLISPIYYGIIGLALFFHALLGRMRSFKLTDAFLKKRETPEVLRSTFFFLSLILGLISFSGTLLLYSTLQRIYSSLMLKALLILSLEFITSSIGRPSGAILRKELKFKAITITRLTSIGVSSVASILLALEGYGLWSLVIYTLLERILRQFFFWFFSSWRPTFSFNKKLAKYYLTFGGILLISSQFNFLFLKMNQFIVGTWLSSVDLAFYNRAFSFTNYLVVITAPIVSTAQPIYAESQENKRVLTKTYNLSLAGITHLSWPLSIALFLVAPSFIEFLIGAKWLPAVPVFRVLTLTALTLPLINLSTKLFNMVGRPKKTMKIKMLQGGLTSLSFPFIYIFGVKGAALSMGIAASVGVAIILYKYLPEHVNVSFKKIFGPPLSAIISALSIYFLLGRYRILPIVPSHPFSLLIELLFKVSIFLSLYLLFLFLIERERLLKIVKRLYKAFI